MVYTHLISFFMKKTGKEFVVSHSRQLWSLIFTKGLSLSSRVVRPHLLKRGKYRPDSRMHNASHSCNTTQWISSREKRVGHWRQLPSLLEKKVVSRLASQGEHLSSNVSSLHEVSSWERQLLLSQHHGLCPGDELHPRRALPPSSLHHTHVWWWGKGKAYGQGPGVPEGFSLRLTSSWGTEPLTCPARETWYVEQMEILQLWLKSQEKAAC